MNPGHIDLFATTRWTVVLEASQSEEDLARQALEELCRIYWFPLYAYARGRGYGKEDAEDLTQGFLSHILKRENLGRADELKLKFRTFLLASMKNYMANVHVRNNALKRGRMYSFISMESMTGKTAGYQIPDHSSLSSEEIYDREWALTLLDHVLSILQQEWNSKERQIEFDVLKEFLLPEGRESQYSDIERVTGVPKETLRVHTHRLRKRYRELLREEIGRTLHSAENIKDEIENLKKAFQR